MAEPISLDLAKLQCRVLDDDEDDLFEQLISAARAYVENITSTALVQRVFIEGREEFGCYIELHRRPIVSIDALSYIDTDGVSQAYADYIDQISRDPARIYPDGEWPTLHDDGWVTVTYTAGYSAGNEPPELIQAMLLLIGHWYDNRESVVVGDVPNEVQLAVQSLCAQYWRPVA